VCLGIRPQGSPPCAQLGRETFLAPDSWDDQGWPLVGENGRIRVELEAPRLTPVTWPALPVRDDFDGPDLGLAWNFLGNPDAEAWSLTARPGALTLRGNAAQLDDGPPVVFVGRRQEHLECEVATLLDFVPPGEGEEAGLTVWINPRHHYDLFVSQQDGQRCVAVRRRIGSLTAMVAREPIEDGAATLVVRTDPHGYTFGYTASQAEEQTLANGEARYLSPEVAGGFTGVYFALYATGNGNASRAGAAFDWFDYRVLP
jgi:alpha-N-arabinofuranosidase